MAKKLKEKLMPCTAAVEGDVVPKLIIGTTGRTYRHREVVRCVFPAGLFGTRNSGRTRKMDCALHNGLLNQCSIKEGVLPTPYWAVLDAMITLKTGFTRRTVVDLAVEAVGESKRRACEMSWDVLKNHHRHARKREAGLAYMIDDGNDGKLLIRARDAGETLQYFDAQPRRRKEAEAVVAAVAEGTVT